METIEYNYANICNLAYLFTSIFIQTSISSAWQTPWMGHE